MRQPTVVLDMDGKSYPVIKLDWSHYDGKLVSVVATTPYAPFHQRMDMLFKVGESGDGIIRLWGVHNPNFTAVLML
jgi:hypothetical protein